MIKLEFILTSVIIIYLFNKMFQETFKILFIALEIWGFISLVNILSFTNMFCITFINYP
ncbi:MAG: hypothetical protein ACI8WT_004491 [Clostridium sp.]|jgi:hypothetical protein